MKDIDPASASSSLGQAAPLTDASVAQEQLLKVNRALKLLSDGNEVLVRAKSEQQLLDDICRLIVEPGGYLMAWVGMAEADEAKTVRPVAHYGDMAGYLEQARISWDDTEQGRGPSGSAIRTGRAQVNQSVLTNPAMKPWRAAALKSGYQSSLALPLKDGDKAFGALTIYSVEPHAFHADDSVSRLHAYENDARRSDYRGYRQRRLQPTTRAGNWLARTWQTSRFCDPRLPGLQGNPLFFWSPVHLCRLH